MRYKKSKDGRDKFMGRTAGYTLLLHRKNRSTLKDPVEGKRCSDIKNGLKIVNKLTLRLLMSYIYIYIYIYI